MKESTLTKVLLLIMGLGVFYFIAGPLYLVGILFFTSIIPDKEVVLNDDPHIGHLVNFDAPGAYFSDCKNCNDEKKVIEIDRSFWCLDGNYLPELTEYDNLNYVPSNMKFEVTEVISNTRYGINGGTVKIAVLKDENGLLSTIPLLTDYAPLVDHCDKSDIFGTREAFRYIEKNGTARIRIPVYDSTKEGATKAAEILLSVIKNSPPKYTFSNLTMAESFEFNNSFNNEYNGIEADVDAEALLYLTVMKTNFAVKNNISIGTISIIDQEYVNSASSR